jgi:hypothetical protein
VAEPCQCSTVRYKLALLTKWKWSYYFDVAILVISNCSFWSNSKLLGHLVSNRLFISDWSFNFAILIYVTSLKVTSAYYGHFLRHPLEDIYVEIHWRVWSIFVRFTTQKTCLLTCHTPRESTFFIFTFLTLSSISLFLFFLETAVKSTKQQGLRNDLFTR